MSSATSIPATSTPAILGSARTPAKVMRHRWRYSAMLLALVGPASMTSGCMADGDDYGEFDGTQDVEAGDGDGPAENVGQTQQAFSNPNQGTWPVAFYKDRWGKNELNHCSDFAGNLNCAAADYSKPNKLSSFRICNNLGGDNAFRVRLWDHDDYVDLMYNETFTIESDSCIAYNVPSNYDNKTSALKVSP